MLWADMPPAFEKVKSDSNLLVYVVAGIGAIVALWVLLKIAKGKKRHPDLEKGQREKLGDYPPPPPAGNRELLVNSVPARLRLVVLAPTGSQNANFTADEAGEILDDVLKGLGSFLKADKPRVKIWPAQLTIPGFAPSFHRLVLTPDAGAKSSPWIKLAGPARVGKKTFLVGLALLADEETKLGEVHMDTTDWQEMLQIG